MTSGPTRVAGSDGSPTVSTSVRLRDPSTRMSGELGSEGSGGAGEQLTGYYTDPVLSQIQVLKSRAVAAMVVDSLGLQLQPEKPDFPYRTLGRVAVNSAARPGDTLQATFVRDGVTATQVPRKEGDVEVLIRH